MKEDFDSIEELEEELLEEDQLKKGKKSRMKISGEGVFTLLKEIRKRKK